MGQAPGGGRRAQQNVEKYFPPKRPKSMSLDSGHLDKPFGPLIFKFFQYFYYFLFNFFLNDFWTIFPIAPLKS